MRIAMWSGPRNLSTAMMYAFGARSDMAVIDEPFYAACLAATGLDHPMRDAVLASQPTDPGIVSDVLTGSIPAEKPHFYQKHMCQHMVPSIPRDWMTKMVNVFLIRHPARVIASFGAKYDAITLADIGFTQQTELFDHARALGQTPVVIDSADVRRGPERMLRALCDTVGLNWDPAMLSWPAGGHAADGVWAPVWYGAVHRSTGFAGPEGDLPDLNEKAAELLEEALPHYERLAAIRLVA
jgi:Sulfotransferase domain